jgi:hypothetical protein
MFVQWELNLKLNRSLGDECAVVEIMTSITGGL